MKKYFIIILLTFMSQVVNGQGRNSPILPQYEKGQTLLGVGYTLGIGNGLLPPRSLLNSGELRVNAGKFVMNNLLLGITYSTQAQRGVTPVSQLRADFTTSTLHVFSRYYATNWAKINAYVEGGLGVAQEILLQEGASDELTSGWASISSFAGLGASIPIKKKMSIDISTMISLTRNLRSSQISGNGPSYRLHLQPLNVGFNFHL
ncbi:MAG: hypothetical protein AAFY71_23270 [Bacteroidota bacterium]